MTLGDDLAVMLGLVPVRDRAGIQRGTMATEAARAADGNAEGQALTRQGFDFARAAPPPVQLPPGMGAPEPDAANMPIAGGAPAQFVIPGSTGGPSAAPTPAPRERVVAASPAAAPSPVVTRHSDILLQAIEQQKRQAKMQQLFNGLGLLVNGFNRNPDSSNATQRALSGGGGGGGGPDINTLKMLLDMRAKEDTDIANKAAKEREIQDAMLTQGLSRERATVLVEQGQYKDRNAPAELRAAQGIRDKALQRNRVREMIPDFAKATGTNPDALYELNETDPDKVLELMKPGALETVKKQRLDNEKAELEAEAHLAHVRRVAGESGTAESELLGPEASAAARKRSAELRAEAGPKAAEKAYDKFIEVDHETGKANEAYLKGSAQEIGKLWHPGMITGTWAQFRQTALHRPLMTFLEKYGYNSENVNSTAQLKSILARITTENVKTIPGPAGVKDVILASTISGSDEMTPNEIRAVATMIESINRQGIITHNEKADAMEGTSNDMAGKFRHVRRIEMPEPSKILKDNVYAEGNKGLREGMATATQQLKAAKGTPQEAEARAEFIKMRDIFDEAHGPAMGIWYATKVLKGTQ